MVCQPLFTCMMFKIVIKCINYTDAFDAASNVAEEI